MINYDESGQSLIEVLVALVVAAIVITALVITILTGLKNSQFAQKQTQATKYAQDAMDKVRVIRDRGGNVDMNTPSTITLVFMTPPASSNIWDVNLSSALNCGSTNGSGLCYFQLSPDGSSWKLTQTSGNSVIPEDLGDGLSRYVTLNDEVASFATEKKLTVKVTWSDSSGSHESNLQTILTPL